MQGTCNHRCILCEIEETTYRDFVARQQQLFTVRGTTSTPVLDGYRKKRGGRGGGLTEDEKAQIKKLATDGLTQVGIAKRAGVSKTTVARVLGTQPSKHVPKHP